MALTQKNELRIAFKKLLGKSHTSAQIGAVQEAFPTNIQLDSTIIFGEKIPLTPPVNLYEVDEGNIVQKVKFNLSEITTANYSALIDIDTTGIRSDGDGAPPGESVSGIHAYKLYLDSEYEDLGSSNIRKAEEGTFFFGESVVVESGGRLQLVPEKYGYDYVPIVYDSEGGVIYSTDEEDYYLDTYSGILFVQDVRKIPSYIEAYIYVGKFQDELTGTGGGGTGFADRIGDPEDATYTDGLFKDFIPDTRIGVAIDRFNEILSNLVPSPAPNLTNIEASVTSPSNMKIAFTNAELTNYTDVVSLSDNLPIISVGQTFSTVAGPGGGLYRLGSFASPRDLTTKLNRNVAQDGLNYRQFAFNVPSPQSEEKYIVEINGIEVVTASLNSTSSYADAIFSISDSRPGAFPTGSPFELWRHRTGSVNLPSVIEPAIDTWTLGHNYAKVIFSSSAGLQETNYLDWIYEPEAGPAGPVYEFSSTLQNLVVNGDKYLSGIRYYTDVSFQFSSIVNNFYKNIYSSATNGGITFSTSPTALSPTAVTNIPIPTSVDDSLTINSQHTLTGTTTRLLGSSVSSTININNSFGKTGSSVLQTGTVFLDRTGNSNSPLIENFNTEAQRVNMAQNTDVSLSSDDPFLSQNFLASDELAVFGGQLIYPSNINVPGIITNGNIAAATVDFLPSGQPDYSPLTGQRSYVRRFRNYLVGNNGTTTTFNAPTNNLTKFRVRLTADPGLEIQSGIQGTTLVPPNLQSGTKQVKMYFKIPGQTTWLDITIPNTQLSSGVPVGCLTGDSPSTKAWTGNVLEFAIAFPAGFVVGTAAPNDSFYFKIDVCDQWAGYIEQLELYNYNDQTL